MLKKSKRTIAVLLLLLPLWTHADVLLPDLPEPYQAEITYGDIWNAFLNAEFAYATRLLTDKVYQELMQALNNEKKIAVLLQKLAQKLAPLLNDPNKSNAEKGQAIVKEIEMSLEPYESAPVGDLNLAFKHSIEYGVTRLTWDKKVTVDECPGALCQWQCDCDPFFGCSNCVWSCRTWKDYVRKEPDYYIYRILNGQEKLITKLKGRREIHRESITFSADVWSTIKSAYDFDRDFRFGVDDSKAFFHDLNSDYRNQGQSLAYRVVADNSPYRFGNCGVSETFSSTGWVDQNADGRIDFIPPEGYARYFGKYFGWLIPTLQAVSD